MPLPAYTKETLFWVESAILSTPPLSLQEWRDIRGKLGMTPEQFAAYLNLPLASIDCFEREGDEEVVRTFGDDGLI